jgi:hypothetical protein
MQTAHIAHPSANARCSSDLQQPMFVLRDHLHICTVHISDATLSSSLRSIQVGTHTSRQLQHQDLITVVTIGLSAASVRILLVCEFAAASTESEATQSCHSNPSETLPE